MRRTPTPPGVVVGLVLSTLAFFGLAIWGGGGWTSYFAHPARLWVVIGFLAMGVLAAFSGVNLSTGKRSDPRDRKIFPPVILGSLLLAWAPAYTDHRGFWTIDGDAIRYTGLVLALGGGALRTWTMFRLGRRFSAFAAIQEGHTLETGGVYRVIRHPSYLGVLVSLLGWTLVFRSGVGVLISLTILPIIVIRMNMEDDLLAAEFGAEFERYRQRTARLVPFLY